MKKSRGTTVPGRILSLFMATWTMYDRHVGQAHRRSGLFTDAQPIRVDYTLLFLFFIRCAAYCYALFK